MTFFHYNNIVISLFFLSSSLFATRPLPTIAICWRVFNYYHNNFRTIFIGFDQREKKHVQLERIRPRRVHTLVHKRCFERICFYYDFVALQIALIFTCGYILNNIRSNDDERSPQMVWGWIRRCNAVLDVKSSRMIQTKMFVAVRKILSIVQETLKLFV